MTDAPKPDDVTALVERLRKANPVTYPMSSLTCLLLAASALERLAADNARLTRERDEARIVLAAADKGTPIYKAVERVLDAHSAWIARPSEDVTKAIALAAGVAWMAAEKVDPSLAEIDAALAAARSRNARLRDVLSDTVSAYGRPGGPWNIPSDPGEWLERARAALAQGEPRDGE